MVRNILKKHEKIFKVDSQMAFFFLQLVFYCILKVVVADYSMTYCCHLLKQKRKKRKSRNFTHLQRASHNKLS